MIGMFIKDHNLAKSKKWLLISHAFNMDGRAASLTITDKIPYFLEAGVQPIVLSAITGVKDTFVKKPSEQITSSDTTSGF